MKNLLEQLENNEAILLMYLAGELPDEDRAEVEQMLAGDAGLRATLDELRALEGSVATTLAQLDALEPQGGIDAAVRRTSRAMSQALTARALSAAPATGAGGSRRLRVGWLMYPAAAAAAIVVAAMLYMNQAPTNPGKTAPADTIATDLTPAIFPEDVHPDDVPKSQLARLEDDAMSLSSAARFDDDSLGLRALGQ